MLSMVKALDRPEAEGKAQWIACALMLLGATAVLMARHPIGAELYFGDSEVFAAAGDRVARGQDPYAGAVVGYHENGLPFISPPVIATLFGAFSAVFGPLFYYLLLAAHMVAMVGAPLIQSKLYLGEKRSHLALGYAAFFCGVGAFGVTTFVSGNFGASMHLACIAGLAWGVRKGEWKWAHLAIALSCLVKPTYAAYWLVPALYNGWNWREIKTAAIWGAGAAAVYAISYAANPDYFHAWLGSLNRQIAGTGDYGHSVYGLLAWQMIFHDHQRTLIPYIAHIAVMGALLAFLLLDKTKGIRKAAALVVLAIVANPRMKEYDAAFAAIPLAALYLSAFIPPDATSLRRGLAVLAVALIYLAMIYADHLPVIGEFIYVIAMGAGILTLRLKRPDLPVFSAAAPQA